MSKRGLMLVNSLFRMGYGLGALYVPSKMAELNLAADTAEHPPARLFVRGFGAPSDSCGGGGPPIGDPPAGE